MRSLGRQKEHFLFSYVPYFAAAFWSLQKHCLVWINIVYFCQSSVQPNHLIWLFFPVEKGSQSMIIPLNISLVSLEHRLHKWSHTATQESESWAFWNEGTRKRSLIASLNINAVKETSSNFHRFSPIYWWKTDVLHTPVHVYLPSCILSYRSFRWLASEMNRRPSTKAVGKG